MKDALEFAKYVGGELMAGCVIATVDGKKQYLYRDGEFSETGRRLYNAFSAQPKPENKPKQRGARHD